MIEQGGGPAPELNGHSREATELAQRIQQLEQELAAAERDYDDHDGDPYSQTNDRQRIAAIQAQMEPLREQLFQRQAAEGLQLMRQQHPEHDEALDTANPEDDPSLTLQD